MAAPMLLGTTGGSITWEGNATVQYVAAEFIMGVEYTPFVRLSLSLSGHDYEGWKHPVYLEIKTPENPDGLWNTVNYLCIPFQGFRDFYFPSFKLITPIDCNKMITLTVKTKQAANLNSMLFFSNKIKMDKGSETDPHPLSIRWSRKFSAEYDAAALVPGAKYAFDFPLMLKGESKEGWKEEVTLEVELPDGQDYPTTTVYPNDIPLNSYKIFQSGIFDVLQSEGKITLNVITNQESNLISALVIGDVKLNASSAIGHVYD